MKSLPDFSQAMICLLLDDGDRGLIAAQVQAAFEGVEGVNLQDPGFYHITIANLGAITVADAQAIKERFRWWQSQRVAGHIGGAGYFTPDDTPTRVMYLQYNSSQLHDLADNIRFALVDMGVVPSQNNGFTPHITIARGDNTAPLDQLNFNNQKLIFNRLYLVADDFKVALGEPFLDQETPILEVEPIKSYNLDDEGNLQIEVYGVPFRGPDYLDGKDFDGEYFSERTDIGPLEKALSYWEHNKRSQDPLYQKVREYFGTDALGVAEKVGMDEYGWIYRVIIDRAKKYKQLLQRLAEEKMLNASSTPFQRGVEKDADGHWNKWPVVEITLTVSPNNPLAEQFLSKSLDDLALGETMSQENPNLDTSETSADQTQPETLTDQIEKIFDAPDADENGGEAEMTLAKAILDLDSKLDEVLSRLEKVDGIEKTVDEIKLAFPELARRIHQTVSVGSVRSNQTTSEKDAEQIVQQTNHRVVSYLGANAPGVN